MSTEPISAEFPFESKFLDVKESRMHYIDVGEGGPIVFLHGQPTSSYLWRNVIPHVQPYGRCIAPDLIGMGKSGKPDIDYTFDDQYAYLEALIEKLGLKNITLVIHDWGSGLGLHYAAQHPENVKAIAFMEAMVIPVTWESMPAGYAPVFRMIRAPFIGWLMLSVANLFLVKVVPDMILRKLTKEELAHYKAPYPTIASRKPVRVWPTQLPIDGKPKHIHHKQMAWIKWFSETSIPKLFLHAEPGAILTDKELPYVREAFSHMKEVNIGPGKHFIQEDNPHRIGKEIATWYQDTVSTVTHSEG